MVWGTVLLLLWGPRIGSPGGFLLAALALGALSAPVSFAQALAAVRGVPRAQREIARCAGATRFQILSMVVLPRCKWSLMGAWCSGLARALAETAPLLLLEGVVDGGRREVAMLHGLVRGFLPDWSDGEARLGHPLALLCLAATALLSLGAEALSARLRKIDP